MTRVAGRVSTPADTGVTRISLPGRTTIITRVAEAETDRVEAETGEVARSGGEDTPASSTQQERRATRVAGADSGEAKQPVGHVLRLEAAGPARDRQLGWLASALEQTVLDGRKAGK